MTGYIVYNTCSPFKSYSSTWLGTSSVFTISGMSVPDKDKSNKALEMYKINKVWFSFYKYGHIIKGKSLLISKSLD